MAFDEVEELVITGTRDVTADNSGIQSTLSRVDVDQVVSVTRDVRDLARRNALVSQNARGDSGISIAGSNPRTNRITIDGTQAQDDFGLNTGGLPTRRGPVSLDAIEQFSVGGISGAMLCERSSTIMMSGTVGPACATCCSHGPICITVLMPMPPPEPKVPPDKPPCRPPPVMPP